MLSRSYRYRLYPTDEQAKVLRQHIGATRFVYNLALEQRRDWWRQYRDTTGRHLTWAQQSKEVTDLRAEFDWIAAVPRSCLEQALRDLDKAFASFFSGKAKYPNTRVRGRNDGIRLQWHDVRFRTLNAKWSALRIPNLGSVKVRTSRPLEGAAKNVTISLVSGEWFASVSTQASHEVEPLASPSVGIDRGIANTLTLSTGEHFSIPASLAGLDRRRRRAQSVLARRQRGSTRRAKALRRAASIAARIVRVRRDWHHRVSTEIANRFGYAVLEKLAVANMTRSAAGTISAPGRNVRQKAGLNRSILNQGWHAFATMLAYKLEERGGQLIYVPAAYTSQTCAECGSVRADNRKSQAVFECVDCGHRAHADVNAAINILRGSTPAMRVEEAGCGSVETRTGRINHPENLALVA